MSSALVVDTGRQIYGGTHRRKWFFDSYKHCPKSVQIRTRKTPYFDAFDAVGFLSPLETVSFLLHRYSFKHSKIQSFGSEYALYSNVYNFFV